MACRIRKNTRDELFSSSADDRSRAVEILTDFLHALTDLPFLAKHRKKETDFTRTRRLPFLRLILFSLISFGNNQVREALEMIEEAGHEDLSVPPVTPSALCQALKKLPHAVFIEANRILCALFRKIVPLWTWRGFRLCAIDGSRIDLPRSRKIAEAFVPGVDASLPGTPNARLSTLLDVGNALVLDARLSSCQTGERELALLHLDCLGEGDLLLTDRGYPSFELFSKIREREAHFCVRMPASWSSVQDFLSSGDKDRITRIGTVTPLPVRLLRLSHAGAEMVVITSLLDRDLYPAEAFSDLYHQRWCIEEGYKELKGPLHLEGFSGRSEEAIRRELHARILTQNLISVLAFPSLRALQKRAGKKLPVGKTQGYKPNRAALAFFLKKGLRFFFDPAVSLSELVDGIFRRLFSWVSAVCPGRSFPRRTRAG